MLELRLVEEGLRLVGVDVGHGDEVFLTFVLDHRGQQVLDFARGAEEHLALAVLHVFLDVEGDRFGDAEILHGLRDGDTQLAAQVEEVVNGVAGGEHNGSVVQDGHLLLSELFSRNALNFDERAEDYLYPILARNIVIWRLIGAGFRLRY